MANTDAHRTQELDWIRYRVDQAGRDWYEARDVANTCHLASFRKLIRKTGRRRSGRGNDGRVVGGSVSEALDHTRQPVGLLIGNLHERRGIAMRLEYAGDR